MSAPFDPSRPHVRPLDPSTLDPRRPSRPSRSTAGVVTLAVVGGFGVLLTLVGAVTSGLGGLLLGAGLTLLVLGLGAVVVGRAWWALMPSRRVGGGVLGVGVVLLVVAAVVSPAPTSPPTSPSSALLASTTSGPATTTTSVAPTTTADPAAALVSGASAGTALAALGTLQVKGRAPGTGYDRDVFGQAWADVDRNGCDTRNDVLARDLTAATVKPGTRGCLVLSGTLADPYTASTIAFVRGVTTSEAVEIDHVVSLSDAWQKGAQAWDLTTRTAFANDPLNLLATDGPTNSAKGDGDAATWLPPSTAFRCEYVARQVSVKVKYHVWVTDAERVAIARVLSSCADETVVSDVSAVGDGPAHQQAAREAETRSAPVPTTRATVPTRAPTPVPATTQPSPAAYYASCAAARAGASRRCTPAIRGTAAGSTATVTAPPASSGARGPRTAECTVSARCVL